MRKPRVKRKGWVRTEIDLVYALQGILWETKQCINALGKYFQYEV